MPVRNSLVPVVLVVDGVGEIWGVELVVLVAVTGEIDVDGELVDPYPVPYGTVTNGGPE